MVQVERPKPSSALMSCSSASVTRSAATMATHARPQSHVDCCCTWRTPDTECADGLSDGEDMTDGPTTTITKARDDTRVVAKCHDAEPTIAYVRAPHAFT